MDIRLAKTDTEIKACFPVMKELRQDLIEADFVPKIRELEKAGYMLAYLEVSGKPISVAGFSLGESLSWKRYLYVADLITLNSDRSNGFGSTLLDWLTKYACENGCETFHLDSGIERNDAHRFYEREGLNKLAYHFAKYVNA